jgi:hypothetical protein
MGTVTGAIHTSHPEHSTGLSHTENNCFRYVTSTSVCAGLEPNIFRVGFPYPALRPRVGGPGAAEGPGRRADESVR